MYHAEVIDISREHALFAYADAYTRYANNMYNTANYYIRNLMTGLKKDVPTPNEASVIGIVRKAVPEINVSLRKKYETKATNIRADRSLTDAGRAEKLRKLKCSVFRMPTSDTWFAGYSLLDAVFRGG